MTPSIGDAALTFSATRVPDKWLNQGDIFKSVPIVRGGAESKQAMRRGPAMLVSHGCVLDKTTRNGRPSCEYLSFAPIQSVEALAADNLGKANDLRGRGTSRAVAPYTAQYLGDLEGLGEAYAALNQPFTLPAVLFQTSLVMVDRGDGREEPRLTIDFNDTRIAQLMPEDLDLFRAKWAACWLGIDLRSPDA